MELLQHPDLQPDPERAVRDGVWGQHRLGGRPDQGLEDGQDLLQRHRIRTHLGRDGLCLHPHSLGHQQVKTLGNLSLQGTFET